MRKLSLIIVSLMLIHSLFAGDWKKVKSDDPAPAKTTLISSTIETTVIRLEIPGFFLDEVTTPNGKEYIVILEEATPILFGGDPDLVKLTTSVLIPDLAQMDVEVLSSEFVEFSNISIAPSKGNLTRDIDPSTVPYIYGKHYNQNQFFPGKLGRTARAIYHSRFQGTNCGGLSFPVQSRY